MGVPGKARGRGALLCARTNNAAWLRSRRDAMRREVRDLAEVTAVAGGAVDLFETVKTIGDTSGLTDMFGDRLASLETTWADNDKSGFRTCRNSKGKN